MRTHICTTTTTNCERIYDGYIYTQMVLPNVAVTAFSCEVKIARRFAHTHTHEAKRTSTLLHVGLKRAAMCHYNVSIYKSEFSGGEWE